MIARAAATALSIPLLALSLASSGRAAPPASGGGLSAQGALVELVAMPQDNFYRVPPPPEFLAKSGGPRLESATINVNYIGSWTPQAQGAFQYAVDIWKATI